MRATLLLQDGLTQIVITPESDFEKKLMDVLRPEGNYTFFRGVFNECRGGWVRPYMQHDGPYGTTGDDSLILCVRDKTPDKPEQSDAG